MINSPSRIAWDFRTPDLALMRRRIAAMLKPFSLEASANAPYDARVCHRRLFKTELTLIDYGKAIRVDAGRMKRFHLVQIPLRGGYWFEADGERLHVGVGQAHVVRPDLHLRMDWSSGCQLLVLRTTDSRLGECAVGSNNGSRGSNQGAILACSEGPGASFGRTVAYLAGELMQGGLLRAGTLAAEIGDSLLISALVRTISSATAASTREQRDYVARAQQHILMNLKGDLSLTAIVAASGVSSRSLFRSFRAIHGMSPMIWARHLRLQGVRTELQNPRCNHWAISQVASNWGFTHLGHFCEVYRHLHGETPTETRRTASR